MVVLDRSRQTEQLADLKKSIDVLSGSIQQLGAGSGRPAAAAAEPAPLPPVTAPATAPLAAQAKVPASGMAAAPGSVPAGDAVRDGNPKLGVNFLLPYDRTAFHPEWVSGTLSSLGSTSKSINPLTDQSGDTANLHNTINSNLCFRHPAHPEQWMSELAESLIISEDYKVYTFTIRKGVKWQTPTIASKPEFAWIPKDVELTAHDFVFMFQLIQNPDVECPSIKSYYEDLDKVEAPDDYTLRLTWKRKVTTSLAFSMEVNPLPRHIYTRNRDGSPISEKSIGVQFNKNWFDEERQAIGVGAYILDAYEPDHRIRYRRNPAFWGESRHFEYIEDNCTLKQPDAILVAFKNGDLTVNGLRPNQYKSEILDRHEPRFAAYDPANPKAGRSGELAWENCQTLRFSYIGWNMRTTLFKDKRVRQAMSHAFPKDRIIKDVFQGLGEPVLSDVHPTSQYYNRDLKPYAFDLAEAKRLLTEAGWSDTDGDGILDHEDNGKRIPLRFTVKYSKDSVEWDATLLIFRDELRKIGVDLVLKTLEWPEMMRVYEDKDFDAVVGQWSMDWDIDYFQLWHSSQVSIPGSSNHCGFANKRLDELADKLRVTFDVPERIAIAKECQAILHEEQPYTFFMNPHSIFCWHAHGPPAKNLYLDGVVYGLDHLHPLTNRSMIYWHFVGN
jgi:ABC-type transport system substrate-binding protein